MFERGYCMQFQDMFFLGVPECLTTICRVTLLFLTQSIVRNCVLWEDSTAGISDPSNCFHYNTYNSIGNHNLKNNTW